MALWFSVGSRAQGLLRWAQARALGEGSRGDMSPARMRPWSTEPSA